MTELVEALVQIVGDKHDNALELVQRMEKSELFRGPKLVSDTTQIDQRTGGTIYKIDIETYYIPGSPNPQRPAAREGF